MKRLDLTDEEIAAWNALTGREITNRPCDECEDGLVEHGCGNCSGSGEGPADGTICRACNGQGVWYGECENLCSYCGEHAALNDDGACDRCAASEKYGDG